MDRFDERSEKVNENSANLIVGRRRDADATWFGYALKPCRNIHVVPKYVMRSTTTSPMRRLGGRCAAIAHAVMALNRKRLRPLPCRLSAANRTRSRACHNRCFCEGFRMPAAAVAARHIRAAGVRKPPREETAHGGQDWCGRLYGDLGAAGELGDGVRTGAASGTTLSLSLNDRWALSSAINDRRMGDDR